MEQLVIKMRKEYYLEDKDIKQLLAYIAGKGKNEKREKVIRVQGMGVPSTCQKAAIRMVKMQKRLKKDKGRRCYQLIVSFPESIDDCNVVILAAHAIADMILKEMHFQSFYGIHTSTENLHIHFGINAVNYKSGKKWHQNNNEFRVFRKRILEVVNYVMSINGYSLLCY